MSKIECPHCGKPGISHLRKMSLSPAFTATCSVCGKAFGIPYISMLAYIPLIVAVISSKLVEPIAMKIAILVGGFIVSTAIHIRWVPLKPR